MSSKRKTFCVAIVGHGTVGSATAYIIQEQYNQINERCNITIKLKYIVVRKMPKNNKPDTSLYTTNLDKVMQDPEVDCIVELIGGTDAAYDIFVRALNMGKHVVSGNKALLAHFGSELWGLARKKNKVIGFEASCCGGIPIISTLTDGLIANRIDAIVGIMNGTCNYILSKMQQDHVSYREALKTAQEAGIAEPDPTLDVNGSDSGHKIAIMASLAFGLRVNFEHVSIAGIDTIDQADIALAASLGYEIKLLAAAVRTERGINIWVRPTLVSTNNMLSTVGDCFNAVSIYGNITGHSLYYGRGAGGMPTASAIIADIISVAAGRAELTFTQTNYWQDSNSWHAQIPHKDTFSRYYIRIPTQLTQLNIPTQLASLFKHYSIPIAHTYLEQYQTDANSPKKPYYIIITDTALEKNVSAVVNELASQKTICCAPCTYMAIAEEYQEHIMASTKS